MLFSVLAISELEVYMESPGRDIQESIGYSYLEFGRVAILVSFLVYHISYVITPNSFFVS